MQLSLQFKFLISHYIVILLDNIRQLVKFRLVISSFLAI